MGRLDSGDIILLLIGLGLLIWVIGARLEWLPGLTSLLGIPKNN